MPRYKFGLSLPKTFGQHGRMTTVDIPVFILWGGLGFKTEEKIRINLVGHHFTRLIESANRPWLK